MVFEVDGATKQLQKISGQTLIAGEKNSQYIRFIMPRYWDGIDVSEKTISIIHGLAGKYYGETAAVSAERTDDKLRFGWVVPADACCIAGPLLFVLVVQDSNYILKTQITETPVLKSINLDDVVPEPTKEAWYRDFQLRVERTLSDAENAVNDAREILEEARRYVGAPMVATTAADMTDHTRIYVYTGSETGYTSGDWYYWDGSSWEDGGVYNAVAVETDTSLSIQGRAADAKKTGDEISELKEDLNAIQTATSEDVGKALKAKTVADGKVVEWEFGEAGGGGGEDYYTETPSLNLCDSSEWTDATSSPLLPAEYGKTYSSNINTYGFNTRVYDANKTSLGALNAYGGVTVTKGSYYDGTSFKYTYEVTDEAIAYIQFRITKPDIPNSVPMWLEGDVDIPVIPIAFDDTRISPVEPALGDLKSVMLSSHKVARAELDSDLSNAIEVLGYSDKVVQSDDIYNFDASTSELRVYDGVVQAKDGVTSYSNLECLYFDSSVNKIHYDFTNVANPILPWVIVKDNFVERGLILSLTRTGMTYVYYLGTDNSVQAKDNSFAWTSENPLVSVDIVRNSDNYVLTFIDSTDAEIVKTYTFAQLGITSDPGKLGLFPRRPSGSNRNCAVICTDLKISAKSSISGGSSASSRLAEKTWDAWGDSFTAGDSSYPSKVATETGCTATNLGLAGDKVVSVLSRFNARSDACGSYVTVFAGVNDFLHDTEMATFRTNVQDMITAVITKAPSSKFGWVIPPQTTAQATNTLNLTLEDYDDAIIEICRANSVPVLDLYHEGGWYTNSAFTSIYIGGDGLHPSAQGQALLADKIQLFLERL